MFFRHAGGPCCWRCGSCLPQIRNFRWRRTGKTVQETGAGRAGRAVLPASRHSPGTRRTCKKTECWEEGGRIGGCSPAGAGRQRGTPAPAGRMRPAGGNFRNLGIAGRSCGPAVLGGLFPFIKVLARRGGALAEAVGSLSWAALSAFAEKMRDVRRRLHPFWPTGCCKSARKRQGCRLCGQNRRRRCAFCKTVGGGCWSGP